VRVYIYIYILSINRQLTDLTDFQMKFEFYLLDFLIVLSSQFVIVILVIIPYSMDLLFIFIYKTYALLIMKLQEN
jgi:hypothetical protein